METLTIENSRLDTIIEKFIKMEQMYQKQDLLHGKIVPSYQVKKEYKIQDFLKYQIIHLILKLTIIGLGNKKPQLSYLMVRERILERIESVEDEDIKRESKKEILLLGWKKVRILSACLKAQF